MKIYRALFLNFDVDIANIISEEKNMLSKNIQKLINEQINKELFSAYVYLEIASYFGEQGLNGLKKWFDAQAKEEVEHAEKFYNYLIDEGAHVVLETIEAPKNTFKNVLEPVKLQLEHERYVTASIYTIYEAALKENDHRTALFLQWFIEEQQEEEMQSEDMLQKFEMIGESKKGLYMLDRDFGNSRE